MGDHALQLLVTVLLVLLENLLQLKLLVHRLHNPDRRFIVPPIVFLRSPRPVPSSASAGLVDSTVDPDRHIPPTLLLLRATIAAAELS